MESGRGSVPQHGSAVLQATTTGGMPPTAGRPMIGDGAEMPGVLTRTSADSVATVSVNGRSCAGSGCTEWCTECCGRRAGLSS